MKKNMIGLAISILCLTVQTVHAQCSDPQIINMRKTAIVFGEKDYKNVAPLNNTVNDAQDISDSLKKIGFVVYTYQNTDLKTMNTAIDDWCGKLTKFDVALFYFSGHGAEVNGQNFLFPVDAAVKGQSDLLYATYCANKLLERMENSGTKFNIMVLDACRSNPFTKSWVREGEKGGLAPMSGKGSFIGYAASPGTTASDGDGRNGVYTEGILKFITLPDISIDQIFTRVNAHVRIRTGGKQIPFKNSSFSSDFCFTVHREMNASRKSPVTFIQPAGNIACDDENEKIFTFDSSLSGINVRDMRTMNHVGNISISGFSTAMFIAGKGRLIAVDSLHKTVAFINTSGLRLEKHITLQNTPTGITASGDCRVVYLIYNNIPLISQTDSEGKLIKQVPLTFSPTAGALSNDGKTLYLTGNVSGKSTLFALDTKSFKVVRSAEIPVGAYAIALTPDMKKIVTRYKEGDKSHVLISEALTFKVLFTPDSEADQIAFSSDSKYTFISSGNTVQMIGNNDGLISAKLPFATRTFGVTTADDGTALVYLPLENRVFLFDPLATAEQQRDIDPEMNLKKFQQEIQSNSSQAYLTKVREVFDFVRDNISMIVDQLRTELGKGYTVNGYGKEPDYSTLTYMHRLGILSMFDKNKAINPWYVAKMNGEQLNLSIREDLAGKDDDIMSVQIEKLNLPDLRKFIRSYFLRRLDLLK